MKIKTTFALICICLFAILPSTAFAQATFGKMANAAGTADAIEWAFDSDSGVLTISGSGAMPDFKDDGSDIPWYELKEDIKSAKVEYGITKLGGRTFQLCTALRSVDIAGSVKAIGSYAFNSAFSIEEIFLKNGLETLGTAVFNRCGSLKTVVLPRSVKSIGATTFKFTPTDMVVKVYAESDAYNWFMADNGANNSFDTIPNGGVSDKVARTVETVSENYIELTYSVSGKTATAINYGDEKDVIAVFANIKSNFLKNIDMKGVSLKYGKNNINAAESFEQPTGSETKVMLLNAMAALKPLCTISAQTIKPNLHLAGDSIMCLWPETRYGQQGWGEPFRKLFGDNITVVNDAVSGWTAENFYKNKWSGIRQSMKKGDFLMISYLHNDYCISADKNKSNYDPNYKEKYTLYLSKLIEEAQSDGLNVILVLPPNRGINTNFHGDFIDVMPELAQKYNVPFIDLHAKTLEMLQNDLEGTKMKIYMYKLVEQGIITEEQLANHSNATLKNNGEDLTHINVNGAKFLADYVAEQLRTVDPELAMYLKN